MEIHTLRIVINQLELISATISDAKEKQGFDSAICSIERWLQAELDARDKHHEQQEVREDDLESTHNP